MSNQDQFPIPAPPYHHPNTFPPAPQLAPIDYDAEIGQARNLRDYLDDLWKRKYWVLCAFLVVFGSVALYTYLRTPIYRATTLLQITEDSQGSKVSMEDALSKLSGADSLEKFQQTQYKILKSESLALRVIQSLNLKEHPVYKKIKENNPEKSENDIEYLMIKAFLKNTEIAPTRNTFLVEVSYQSSDKAMAQRVVNAIADEYMYLSIDRRNESYSLVRNWLNKQLQEMAVKVQETEKKLYQFGQKADIYTLEDKDNVVVQKFVDLSSLLTKAQAEKMAKEAQFRQIKEKGPNAPLIVNHPLVTQLRQQLVSQQAKVSAMQKVFRAEHPDLLAEKANLIELKGRLQAEVRRLQESVKADYEASNRTEKLLMDSFSEQKGRMAKLQDFLSDFQILKRDAQTNDQFYQALLTRVKEANISGTMVTTNMAVIDPARIPDKPSKPKPLRDLGLGAALGLILGVSLALLVEYLDDTIQSIDDLERACRIPSLGVIPLLLGSSGRKSLSQRQESKGLSIYRFLPWLRRGGLTNPEGANMDLIVYREPKSMVTEAIRQVYSSIMLSTSRRPPAVIMLTSPNPGDGKTTVVSNLAQSYALDERQVVLIDCDLRKPKIHQIYELDSQPGLSNYLTGNVPPE